MTEAARFYLADRPEDYARLGIDPAKPQPFEDGMRISTDPGNLEWWYFDAHLDDGTVIVVTFYGRSPFTPVGPFAPSLEVHIDLPGREPIRRLYKGKAEEFSAATDRCDVRIGPNRFAGDLTRYAITLAVDDLTMQIDLSATIPPFRQDTSHSYFRTGARERFFAWFVAVPEGRVTVRYTIGGVERTGQGYGYHDHNWGDVPMWEVLHDWYWARAKIGPYSVIASYVTAAETFNHQDQINFMLARDGQIVARDQRRVAFSTSDVFQDGETGKPVANGVRFHFADGEQDYDIRFRRRKTILSAKLAEQLPAPQRALAEAAGFDGAYLRFQGLATIESRAGAATPERHEGEAVWELMYFGKARAPAR